MNYQFPSFRDLSCQKLQIQTEMLQHEINNCQRRGNIVQNLNYTHSRSQCLNFTTTEVLKKLPKQQEISFQSHFLMQHLICFERQTKNFMEIFHGAFKNNLQQIGEEKKQIQNNFPNESKQVQTRNTGFFYIQGNQMHGCQKLQEFFINISKTVPAELMPWYGFLWEILRPQYFRIKDVALNQEEIMRYAKKLVNSRFAQLYDQKKVNLYLQKSTKNNQIDFMKDLMKKSLKQYLEFFFTTLILINEQYFSNPYFEMKLNVQCSTIEIQFLSFEEGCSQM